MNRFKYIIDTYSNYGDYVDIQIDSKTDTIRSISLGNVVMPLKRELSIKKYDELKQHLDYLEQLIDLSGLVSGDKIKSGNLWNPNDLIKFMDESSELQKAVLEICSKSDTTVNAEEMQDKLKQKLGSKQKLRALAAVGSAFTRRINKYYLGKEDFFISDWSKKDKRVYTVKDKYKQILKNYFEKK